MTDQIYNLSEFYREEDTLTDKARTKRVFVSVMLFHILFIAGPFLFFAIWEKFYDKKPMIMHVSLVPPSLEKSTEPPGNPPPPVKEEPKPVKKQEPEPEEEPPAPPETPPVKVPEKPVVEPPVKTEKQKVPTEKPVPKPPDVKTWTPKKPAEIKTSNTVVKGKAPTPKINASDLEARLKKIQSQCKVTSTNTGPVTPGPIGNPNVSGTMKASYYDQVTLFLYDLWEQPSKAEVNNQKPSVTVHIAIDASGNVKSASIVKKSGMPAMDASVEALLAKIKTVPLPKPPQGADEFDALLGIDDN